MISKQVTVTIAKGLDIRGSMPVVRLLHKYEGCRAIFYKDDYTINAASLMGILSLGAVTGVELKVDVECPQEKELLDEIVAYLESGFSFE